MMFGGASIVPLVSELLKMYDTILTVMCGVKYSVSLFLNGVYKIPILNHIIIPQTKLYNIFFHGVYYKPHSICNSISYQFHNSNIGLFSINDTRLAEYFMGICRYEDTYDGVLEAILLGGVG